jgi:DtxR family Mn-dependent transcriptional regulator
LDDSEKNKKKDIKAFDFLLGWANIWFWDTKLLNEKEFVMSVTLSASLEDYLEALYWEILDNGVARVKDIAVKLNVRKASVTGALRVLAEKRLVNYTPYEAITLTFLGKQLAKEVVYRHETIRDFFINVLSIDKETADKAACKLEHAIPKMVLERLADFADFVKKCPRAGNSWISGFGYFCDDSCRDDYCEKCMDIAMQEYKKKQNTKTGDKMKKQLNELKVGESGKILRLKASSSVTMRLMDMGLIKGAAVIVERVAPLGDPIDIRIKGYHLSLRREEAEAIEIEVAQNGEASQGARQ